MGRTVGPTRSLTVAFAALAALAVAGCGERSKTAASSPPASTAGQALEDYYIRQKAGVAPDQVPAETRARLLEDLKRLQSAAAAGERSLKPETANAIELSRLEILAHAAAEAAGVYVTPTEAELQQAYQQYLQSRPASEFHAAHILVATESAAATIITKLEGGADFATLAESDSADDSRSKGGDLGWIHPGHLPAAIFDALEALKAGGFTRKPVHTPYGWHVIKLLEARPASPPPFEQVKAQLARNLQQDRYRKFLDDNQNAARTNP